MAVSPPFMYNAEPRNNGEFPTNTFDPKAVTRASWEPKPKKSPQHGPLISFNKHPDAHLVLSHRSKTSLPLSRQTKMYIHWLRGLQLFSRSLALIGTVGALVLLILITKIDEATGWIMRISSGIAILHCMYAVYHLSRKASRRTPGSSAAYHCFSAVLDLTIASAQTYGAFSVHKKAQTWATRLADQNMMQYLIPALYYTVIGVGGLYLVSLSISLWLGVIFRRISLLPPDMNPLEDNLTARPLHKRNKSSITSASTIVGDRRQSDPRSPESRWSANLESDSRPSAVPFLHTRTKSGNSASVRDSFVDLPSRHYQIAPGNPSRGAVYSHPNGSFSAPRSSRYGVYTAVSECGPQDLQGSITGLQETDHDAAETWEPTHPLIPRTGDIDRMTKTIRHGNPPGWSHVQAPILDDFHSDSHDADGRFNFHDRSPSLTTKTKEYPNPLRLHPTSFPQQSLGNVAVQEGEKPTDKIKINNGRFRLSQDMTDEDEEYQSRCREREDSESLLNGEFLSKPYGSMRSGTPPILVGGGRKVSSGIDYGYGYRRQVSGRAAEEGRCLQ